MKYLVIMKTWERMKAEFGMASSECIDTQYGFTDEMEASMPPHRVIELHEDRGSHHNFKSYEWYTPNHNWNVSEDMIAAHLNKDYRGTVSYN